MPSTTHQCDVLIAGSGASGLAAAITARHRGLDVLVVEKAPRFGGTTARSGGWLWVPGTHLARAQGIEEPPGAAREYLRHEAGTHFDAARVDAFLEHGPRAIEFFTSKTCLQFDMPAVFPDYHAEAPGGVTGGRPMLTRPLDGRELGPMIRNLAPPLPDLTLFGIMIGSGADIKHFMRVFKSPESFAYVVRRVARHAWDVLRHGRGMTLTNGNALAGRLAKAATDLDVPLWLNAPVRELMRESGRVCGAIVERDGQRIEVRARRGVVLACGGFPHDVARRARLFAHAPTGHEHLSPSPPANTGDGLALGESAGGWVDPSIPNAAAWVPVSRTYRRDGSQGVMPHFIDRAKPGVIAVDASGRRFANEANSYHDFIQDLVRACRGRDEVRAWLICDHRALRTYGLGCVPPAPMPLGHHLATGYLKRGHSAAELARAIDVDAAALETTLAEYNRNAARGEDPAFGRGTRAYNRFQGDAAHAPNPCVAPLATPPYYAIKLEVGDIGTFAGLAVDAQCRVLDRERRAVEGLYAIGNDAQSIMGGNYPGGGITLGPALTFGYLVGNALADMQQSRTEALPLKRAA
ncbi:MAG: FAD-dependent oxidoreductase [Burkholderiales bacterium]|nr:FAD-dependent oxidoreductase [Burkholderiales bacterium]